MNCDNIRLGTILTALVTGGVLLTSGLLLAVLLFFQKDNIQDSLLQSNIAYARKFANTTDRYLAAAQRELAWGATQVSTLNNTKLLATEVERLRQQSGYFNSVVAVNNQAVVVAVSPESLNLVGNTLHSEASQKAVSSHQPFISQPFISAVGNYVIFLSQPIFTSSGHYLGYIGGTIYLKKQSVLSDILTQHYYSGSSRIEVINDDGMIVYSPSVELVGTSVKFDSPLRIK